MSLIAEFTMRSPRLALQPALEAVPDATVELEGQMVTAYHHPLLVVWATSGDFAAFEAALDRDPTVQSHTVAERLESTRLYRIELVADAVQGVYPVYQDLGATPLAGTGSHEGWHRRVRFPDREALAEFREFCEDREISFRLHRLYRPSAVGDDEFGLTDEQRRALRVAFREGYFEVPRETTLTDLGDELDVSAQSVSERLRRGIRRVLAATACRDDPDGRPKRPE